MKRRKPPVGLSSSSCIQERNLGGEFPRFRRLKRSYSRWFQFRHVRAKFSLVIRQKKSWTESLWISNILASDFRVRFAFPLSILQYWISGNLYRLANSFTVVYPFIWRRLDRAAPIVIKKCVNFFVVFLMLQNLLATTKSKCMPDFPIFWHALGNTRCCFFLRNFKFNLTIV